MTRGGKRPGAGAPKNNVNALKTGRHSRQLKALFAVLSQIPLFQDLILHHQLKEAPRPSRAKLRRLYLELLARLIAAQYIQSYSDPLFSFQDAKFSPDNQKTTLSDLIHNTPS